MLYTSYYILFLPVFLHFNIIDNKNVWNVFLKLINYSCSSYPTRAPYSGQVDGFRNPTKTVLKTRPCLKAVFQIIWNMDANFLNLHIDKATKTRGDKQLFNHTYYETNFKPELFTANVECNGTVIKLPKTEKPILFLNFKLSLNGGDLVFWFTFNLAVDFRPKMALTLEIFSDQMHTLPRNSAEHTLFLFFASFRKSICTLLFALRSNLFAQNWQTAM